MCAEFENLNAQVENDRHFRNKIKDYLTELMSLQQTVIRRTPEI
jgi:hypothetical protein